MDRDRYGEVAFGHTRVRGYHPLLAFGAGTGDLLHARLRGGNANTARGAAGFITETINRVRAAGATGPLTLRADSGFYAHQVVKVCQQAGVRYSITAKCNKGVRKAIQQIPTTPGCRSATGWRAGRMWPRPATARSASADLRCG
jgi:hypothetical protein